MGLLDAFNNLFDGSETHQSAGLGLLSAGLNILANNRGLTAGLPALGIGGAQGLQTYAQAQQTAMERKKMDLQSQLFGAETDYKKAQVGQLNRQADIIKSLLGGSDQSGIASSVPGGNSYVPSALPLSMGMPSFLSAPQQSGTPAAEQGNPYVPGGMFAAQSLPKLAALKLVGGPDMMDFYKYANTPQQMGAGQYIRDPMTGSVSYLDDPKTGMKYDLVTGTMRAIPGYAETNARTKGFETDATERAKGRYTFQPVVGADGVTRNVPASSLSDEYYGGQGGAPTSWHRATVQAESGGNPYAVSPKGATGPYQTMPGTLRDPGFGVQPARDNSPAEQARVGREYFDTLTQRYGSPVLASIATNMGPGAFEKWVQAGAAWNRLPAETRNHVGKTATLEALGNLGQQVPQGGGAPMAAPQGGPRGFVTSDPAAVKFAEGNAASAVKYGEDLVSRVSEGQRLLHTIEEQSNLASQFHMGGGAEARMKLAQMVQAIPGMPQSVVDGFARGDLGALKAFQKVTVNQSIEALRQSIGNNRMNQAEFKQFTSANPNISDDPRGLEKLYGFYARMHERNVRELDERDQYLQAGGSPTRWPVERMRRNANGRTSQAPAQGEAPTAQAPAARATIVRRGTHNGHNVIQYSDGRIEYEGTR